MKKLLSYDYKFYIEPTNPITTPEEFTNELITYFSQKNMLITIIKESMEPVIKIDNETYICKLGEPFRVWKFFKTPINPIAGRFLGYKWIYIYCYTL